MRLNSSFSRTSALLIALALAVAACGGGGAGGAAERETPVPVTIGTAVEMDAANMPFIIADEEGIYEDYGLDVELVHFEGGGALIQAMSGGQTDYGWVAHAPVIRAIEEGAELKTIGEVNMTARGWGWVVTPDSDIESAEDLEPGTRISYTSEGALTHWYATYVAEAAGLSSDEWTGVPLGGSVAAITAALEQGDIDAATVLIPWGEIMEAEGTGRFVDRLDEQLPDFSFTGLHATESALEDETTAGCVMGAYTAAVEWIVDNPEEATDFLERYYDLEPGLAEEVYGLLAEDFNPTGEMDPERLEFVIEQLDASEEFIDGTVTADDVLSQVEGLSAEDCTS